ncbi:MAG: BMC domain-containing protein [Clostridia bacterium]|nr:BMC domain-containing protein [Clostridia bacterium]
MNALGMVEVYGFTTAICCADAAAKAAAVNIIALDTTKPANGDSAEVPLVMIVKMEGSVSAVTAGVAAAKALAVEKGLYIVSHIISRPGPDIDKLAFLSKVGREPIGKKAKKKSASPVKAEEVKPLVETVETPVVKEDAKTEASTTTATAPKKRGRKPKATPAGENPGQQKIGE